MSMLIFLSALVVVLLLLHVWVALRRYSYPPGVGAQIHAPKNWRPPATAIRVSTFNMHRAIGLDGKRDIHRIAALLKQDDIAGLQEVLQSRREKFRRAPDQAAELAAMLQIGWLFAPVQIRCYKKYLGNAILSGFPAGDWQRMPLPHSEGLDENFTELRHRNLLSVRFNARDVFADCAGADSLMFFVTHLARGAIRETQLRFVLAEMARHPTAILTADFNTARDNALLRELLAEHGIEDAIGAALGAKDGARIDHILTRGLRVLDAGKVDAGASDHPYFWAQLAPTR